MLVLAAVVGFVGPCFAQHNLKDQIVGIWQEGDSVVAAMYTESYQFFANGKFVFHTNSFDALERIKEIKGDYRLNADTLYLTATSRVELVGGTVQPGQPPVSGDWEIDDYTLKEIKQIPPPAVNYIIIEKCEKKSSNCLLFNKVPYYKTDSNPRNW